MVIDIISILTLALATAGMALMARALPWPKSWLDKKPLACPVCMSGWAGFAVLFLTSKSVVEGWNFAEASVAWLASVAISAPIFTYVFPAPLEFPPES